MSRLPRVAAALLMLLHVAVAGLLPLADARVEADGPAAAAWAHVEAPDANGCRPAHDELHCQLCSLLRLPAQASPRVALPVVARAVVPPAMARTPRLVAGAWLAPDQARAPPAA